MKNFFRPEIDSPTGRHAADVPRPLVSAPAPVSESTALAPAAPLAALVESGVNARARPAGPVAEWFAAEVHAHESALRHFLRSSFPAVRDVDDVVQESYLRIWKARAAAPIRSARAFLFRIAQHVAIDAVRRHRRSPIDATADFGALDVAADTPPAPAHLEREERIELLAAALDALPTRCREVVLLRKFELLPQREVAARLGISEKAVEKQLERAHARCRAFLARRGGQALFPDGR